MMILNVKFIKKIRSMTKLSISLVTYKPDLKVLSGVLTALSNGLLTTKTATMLYIVDNSCNLSWQKKIKDCLNSCFLNNEILQSEFIISPDNIGYGRANNIAINLAKSDYHLVINPDVFVSSDTFLNAIQFMEINSDVGLLTPAVFGEDGKRHYLCKKNPTLFDMYLRSYAPRLLRKKFSRRIFEFEMRNYDYENIIENVNFPTGCFMFFRTKILKMLNGFDPAFFLYYEDADIGRRLSKIAKVIYVPDVKIVHKWARGTHANLKLKWITVKSGLTYWKKWGGVI